LQIFGPSSSNLFVLIEHNARGNIMLVSVLVAMGSTLPKPLSESGDPSNRRLRVVIHPVPGAFAGDAPG
jgi:hypothetical protein